LLRDSSSFDPARCPPCSAPFPYPTPSRPLVEGPESFTATLAAPSSNATVSTAGTGAVNVTDNDTATVTLSGTANVAEGGSTDSLAPNRTLLTTGTGTASHAPSISTITPPS